MNPDIESHLNTVASRIANYVSQADLTSLGIVKRARKQGDLFYLCQYEANNFFQEHPDLKNNKKFIDDIRQNLLASVTEDQVSTVKSADEHELLANGLSVIVYQLIEEKTTVSL